MKDNLAANLIGIIGILLVSVASFIGWNMRSSNADFYTFTSFADGSLLYIRKTASVQSRLSVAMFTSCRRTAVQLGCVNRWTK